MVPPAWLEARLDRFQHAVVLIHKRQLAGPDAGTWQITGRKAWSWLAHEARFGLLLARTDPDQPKREGLTCFLIDMTSDGVDVRRVRQITGQAAFSGTGLPRWQSPSGCCR
jgi:hypothetical protein